MREFLQRELGDKVDVQMDPDDPDQCTVNFYYDHIFEDNYLRPEIRLEIGPVAEWMPSDEIEIRPFAADFYERIFKNPMTVIRTVGAERTFWEKALILHKTASSYEAKGIPPRYARHYYDLYCMNLSNIKNAAFGNTELLAQDVRFKDKFYYSGNAHYETARPGTFLLVPRQKSALEELARDYDHMKNMIYGEIPAFADIISGLKILEKEINALNF